MFNDVIIAEKMGLGWATLYSLISADLHDEARLSSLMIRKLILLYILPRMIHGLEALELTEAQMDKLNQAYQNIARDL